MRPGSQSYASEHGSYGIATLRRKHVTVKGDLIEFDFPGKSGVRQQRQLRDRQVARVIRETMKLPGFNVFKYQTEDGKIVNVTRQHINTYIKEIMGDRFSAKDFRTWAGTLTAAQALDAMPATNSKTALNKCIVEAIDQVAEALGNTRAVCRKGYIHPLVFHTYQAGITLSTVTPSRAKAMNGLSNAEARLVALLQRGERRRRAA
jgi:DNA topoisomerase-1